MPSGGGSGDDRRGGTVGERLRAYPFESMYLALIRASLLLAHVF
jgi:hypothetical protein